MGLSSTSERSRARKLDRLAAEIRACRICVDSPDGAPLDHEPRPVLQISSTARLVIVGQAPGTRVHKSGRPFTDPSGERLRDWMGVTPDEFYDARRVAIIAMGFCFPGLDAAGGDKPPRKECARRWRTPLFALMPQIELVLLIGQYAQKWHLGVAAKGGMTEVVRRYEEFLDNPGSPRLLPLPHPSWRNNAWLKRNGWFEAELVPRLRREVRRALPLVGDPS
jgi:uracil-DNA glycosylase